MLFAPGYEAGTFLTPSQNSNLVNCNYDYIITEQILHLNKSNLASSLMETISVSFYNV
jgi:hypothetical protein